MTVALASSPYATNFFSEERQVCHRNLSSGHSSVAYFVGKSLAAIPRILLISVHFSAVLYYLSSPVIPFWVDFTTIFLQYFGVYGLCSFVSMLASRSNATLIAVVVSLCSGALSGSGPTLADAEKWNLLWLWRISFNVYSTEARLAGTLSVYDHVWDSKYVLDIYGFSLNNTALDLIWMLAIGIAWRFLAYFAMVLMHNGLGHLPKSS